MGVLTRLEGDSIPSRFSELSYLALASDGYAGYAV